MTKQKKNLWILGGGIVGVLAIALGAFALNPEGGFYKGAITTTVDTKLVEEDLKSESLTKIETDTKTEPAPLPDPPSEEEETETATPIPFIVIGDPVLEEEELIDADPIVEEEYNTTLIETSKLVSTTIELFPTDPEFSAELVGPTLTFEEEGDPETKLESDIPLSLTKVPESFLVPVISGYNPTNTTYLPASYGPDAEVLYFNVNVDGNLLDDIYLHDFYVEYNNCVGNSYQPKTVPTLWSTEYGIWMARDMNMDGKFSVEDNEFDYAPNGLPISVGNGREFSIRMEVDSTMCPAGSFAQVIVRDILWKDANGDSHLDDPSLENDIINSFNDEYSILY